MGTCTLPYGKRVAYGKRVSYGKRVARGNLLYDAGSSNLLCDSLEGGRFRREGTHAYLWLTRVDVWQTPTQYCKAIILQLKAKFLKKYEKKISKMTHS